MADRLIDAEEIQEVVRERYAEAARGLSEPSTGCCGAGAVAGADCCGPSSSPLGCGNPTAVAELHGGEIVLDLGSGEGTDALTSAQRVGPTGYAYGLDMTDEMLELARANAVRSGATNVEFLKGTIESIPLPDDSVDVIISNCVINLSANKARVFAEAARVLRPGGRLAVTDIVADPEMDEETRADLAAWTGCIAGALTEADLRRHLEAAGFTAIRVRETHRVHDHAGSAIIRARMPERA